MTHTRWLMVALLGAAWTAALSAQTVVEEPVLDSVQLQVRDAFYRMRDTLTLVDAAASRMARDLPTTSDQVLRSRARLLAERCQATANLVPATRAELAAGARPTRDPLKLRDQLDQALGELATQMTACVTEFHGLAVPAKAEELRGYGVGRAGKVQGAIRRYEPKVSRYFQPALGIRYMPRTAMAGAPLPPRQP